MVAVAPPTGDHPFKRAGVKTCATRSLQLSDFARCGGGSVLGWRHAGPLGRAGLLRVVGRRCGPVLALAAAGRTTAAARTLPAAGSDVRPSSLGGKGKLKDRARLQVKGWLRELKALASSDFEAALLPGR